jgi:phospholipid-binding lipoprotein MlaA
VVDILRILFVLMAFAIAGCAQTSSDVLSDNRDPYENTNRKIFDFNMGIDDMVLEPVAESYRQWPVGVQESLTNFGEWTGYPSTAVNSTLQGELENAALATIHFLVNGLTLGLADLTEGDDKPTSEDFGQTLARWNIPEGNYVVMPVLGPGTVRSHTGRIVDAVTNPLGFIGVEGTTVIRTASTPVNAITFRGNNFDQFNDLKYNAPDPYARTRSLYFQYREGQITSFKPEETSRSDQVFDNFLEDEE